MKHFDKCALCGSKEKLSFEHIPPRKAFNFERIKPVMGENLIEDPNRLPWDTTGLRYENQQSGMGYYCLCESCNNNTGSWYADEYVTLAHTLHRVLDGDKAKEWEGIGIKGLHPLRFIKQVITMFCDINDPDNPEFDQLRRFVLDKECSEMDKKKYKICMYLTRSVNKRYLGYSILIRENKDKFESIAMSEITAYPFGFILYFDPTDEIEYEGFDITCCADFNYDDECEVVMPVVIKDVNTSYPLDYRTQEQILKVFDRKQKGAK